MQNVSNWQKHMLAVAVAVITISMLYTNISDLLSTPISASSATLEQSKPAQVNDNFTLSTLPMTGDVNTQFSALSAVQQDVSPKVRDLYADPVKVAKLERYLRRRGSPLADYAEVLVMKADEYGIDYRLVASISIIESNGCRHTYRVNNCWGWGGQEHAATFANLEQGIDTVSRGMGRYYANGATSPYAIEGSYCPPCTTWGAKVSSVMQAIEAS